MTTETDSVAALEALAGVLGREEWVRVLTVHGPGRCPRLYVTSRTAPGMASDIYAEVGWYWWPQAQKLAPVSAPRHAAATLTRTILGTTPGHDDPPAHASAPRPPALPRRIPPDRPGQPCRVPPDSPTQEQS
ncbi:MAG TPA: hypothetical protein VGS19_36580 [Streptosporangiaceae bacterium]|nr:hypothetical protein [Streptosporangiaceae bacterium]